MAAPTHRLRRTIPAASAACSPHDASAGTGGVSAATPVPPDDLVLAI
ncbi:MAG TPA: hypothetical protein VLG48_03085 [Candidatus Methylomirabilis sp.]|nr:hypothetical protein [Candidatus Methylomirabilis sp.]